jgi:integrase
MLNSELRLLSWAPVDLKRPTVHIGKNKTEAGAERTIPLKGRAGQADCSSGT